MNPSSIIALLALSSSVFLSHANEQSMNKALSAWNKANAEITAALKQTTDPEERAILQRSAPKAEVTAKALWNSISKRLGTRLVQYTSNGKKMEKRVPTFEYEELWAAPAVIWLLQHSDALGRSLSSSAYSHALKSLLDSVERVHYIHPDMAQLSHILVRTPSVRSYEILEKVFMNNSSPRAQSCAALAMSIMLRDENVYSIEGSKEMAQAKRLFYIRHALRTAPANTTFGALRIEEVALEELYLIQQLEEGSIPPLISVIDEKNTIELPVADRVQILFFWEKNDPASLAVLKTLTKVKEKYPFADFYAITTGIDRSELTNAIPEASRSVVKSYLDPKADAIYAYRVPKASYAVLINEKGRLLYRGEPNLKLEAALAQYQVNQSGRSEKDGKPDPIISPSEPEESTGEAPPLRPIPDFD